MKKILYIDMDNVLVDFQSGIDALPQSLQKQYEGRLIGSKNISAHRPTNVSS